MLYIAVLLLSIFDAVATVFGIEKGYVTEANPLMALLLEKGTFPFFFVKITLTAACLFILKIFSGRALSRWGLTVVTLFYCGLTSVHILYFIIWRSA